MSIVKRTAILLAALLFTALYLVLPFGLAYLLVTNILGPNPALIWTIGLFLFLVMILAEPSTILNLAVAFRLTRPAVALGSILSKAGRTPQSRLAACAVTADVQRRLGNDEAAERLAMRGLAEWPHVNRPKRYSGHFAMCRDVMGHVCLQRGLFQEALNNFYEPLTMELADKNKRLILNLNCIAAMNSLGYFKEALEYVDIVAGLGPLTGLTATIYHCHHAASLIGLSRIDEAVAKAEEAQRSADSPPAVTQAGVTSAWAYVEAGQIAKAKEAMAAASMDAKSSGTLPTSFKLLQARAVTIEGRILAAEGHVDQAISTLTRAVDLSPVAAPAMDALIDLFERQGNVDEAKHWRERLIRDVPESWQARRLSGAEHVGAWPPAPVS